MNKYVIVPLLLCNALLAAGFVVYSAHKTTYAMIDVPNIDVAEKLKEAQPAPPAPVVKPSVPAIVAPRLQEKVDEATAPMESAGISAKQVCYQFTTPELTPQVLGLPNYSSTAKEDKLFTVYWGLGADKDSAIAKFNELKTKGVVDQKAVDLVFISQKYAIATATRSNEKDALSSVREMSHKTTTLGGQWFYMSAPVKTYNVRYATNDQSLAKLVASQYSDVRECN